MAQFWIDHTLAARANPAVDEFGDLYGGWDRIGFDGIERGCTPPSGNPCSALEALAAFYERQGTTDFQAFQRCFLPLKYSTYRNTMIASIDCLILGEASKNNFNVGEVYTNDDKIDVTFDLFIVSNFKELLFRRKKVKRKTKAKMPSYLHRYPATVALPICSIIYQCFFSTFILHNVSSKVLRKLVKRPRLTILEIRSFSEFLDREHPEDIKIPIFQNKIDLLQS
ncbi:2983_t:CDS:2 [Funneliformis mosseae]|uniref:2983_t:CDS:1 n=1 Tax=Funneliformis mosseae TaxID=27381 RepID=A0A9N9CXS4_FUNMO|nr:2983_t:CDS:2 [Funneliformis mosseae]